MLNDLQLQFIETHFKKTKTDKLIENMAKLKSFMPKVLFEQAKMLEEEDCFVAMWDVSFDHAEDYRYRCICGKALKNRYLLRHKYKAIELSIGVTHYKEYCDIKVSDIKHIVEDQEEFSKVKKEFEEKIQTLDRKQLDILGQMESLPKLYQEQLAMGLPLLDRQLKYLKNKRLEHGVHTVMNMGSEMLREIGALDEKRKRAFMIHLESGEVVDSIHDIKALSYSQIRDRVDRETATIIETKSVEMPDDPSENYIKGLGYIDDTGHIQQHNREKSRLLTDRMMKFLGNVADENERASMMKNTLEGVCHITDLNQAKRLSAKFHLQGRLNISMSDRQYEAYMKGSPYNSYNWRKY